MSPPLFALTSTWARDGRLGGDVTIAESHPVFDGHFPGRPVVPGIFHLDFVLAVAAAHATGTPLTLRRLEGFRLKRPIRPGESVAVVLRPLVSGRGWRFDIRSELDLVSEGTVEIDRG